MSQPKLTKSEREKIIFNHLKGIEDPLYEVSQTKYGKWIVKAKQIQLEEEEAVNEPEPEVQEITSNNKLQPINDKQQARREKRKRNRRAKQDAKRILDALNNLINSNNEPDDESDDIINDQQQQFTPQVSDINPSINYNPVPSLRYRRRVLRFN